MVDFFASLAWLLQIALVVVYHEVPGANPNTALVIMEVIRCARCAEQCCAAYKIYPL